jgi:hypothetical protein
MCLEFFLGNSHGLDTSDLIATGKSLTGNISAHIFGRIVVEWYDQATYLAEKQEKTIDYPDR